MLVVNLDGGSQGDISDHGGHQQQIKDLYSQSDRPTSLQVGNNLFSLLIDVMSLNVLIDNN